MQTEQVQVYSNVLNKCHDSWAMLVAPQVGRLPKSTMGKLWLTQLEGGKNRCRFFIPITSNRHGRIRQLVRIPAETCKIELESPAQDEQQSVACRVLESPLQSIKPVTGHVPLAVHVNSIANWKLAILLATKRLWHFICYPSLIVDSMKRLVSRIRQQGIIGILLWLREQARVELRPYKEYPAWIANHDTLTDDNRASIRKRIDSMPNKPIISIIMPVYNTPEKWLRLAIESVRKQLYPYWELCIADDASTKPHVKSILDKYAKADSRIKVAYRVVNGHIAEASNTALSMASGEFITLLDHDDELAEHALYMVTEEINRYPATDLIYSDEDKIDTHGCRFDPHFKPDWNIDLFYSFNLITHLGVYRSAIVKKLGGFRKGYDGSQDYDLALRFIEQTSVDKIRHIPHILYHWRAIPGSVALHSREKKYAHEAARNAIRSHFERTRITATVTAGGGATHRVIYPLHDPLPLVSIIICTRDRVDLLRQTIDGLLKKTDYSPIEVIIIDNQSTEKKTRWYFESLRTNGTARIIPYNAPFNFSAMNNLGARHANGPILAFINNDIKITKSDWLKEMVRFAIRPEIGGVGAKLYYPNKTIQHAGIILGLGGVAGHCYQRFAATTDGYMGRAQAIQSLSAVTAACLVMRKAIFDEASGFDEHNLAIAYNDVDLCLRVKKLGYRILWTPYAELIHLESASRGSDETAANLPRFRKEQQFLLDKWGSLLFDEPNYNPNLSLHRADFAVTFAPRVIRPWLSASIDTGRLTPITEGIT